MRAAIIKNGSAAGLSTKNAIKFSEAYTLLFSIACSLFTSLMVCTFSIRLNTGLD